MREQVKNMMVGVFVLAACFLIIWIVMFLKPSVGDMKETLIVRFSNINQINVGTQVLFAGKPVGEVTAISEVFDARDQPLTDALGRVYFYQLTLKVDSHIKVYDTDEIAIQTSGLLGEKSIGIIPKAPPKGTIPKLITNQPIYADSIEPLEGALIEIKEVAHKVEGAIDTVKKWTDENSANLTRAVTSFADTMTDMDIAIKKVNTTDLVGSASNMLKTFDSVLTNINKGIDTLHKGNTFQDLSDAVHNLKTGLKSFDTVTSDLANGTGTLGRLIKGDDMYLRVNSILSKASTIMDDINHYGLLFSSNKAWQRLRSKRMNLLETLNTPEAFKSYFETEIDQINTAMSRISLLLDRIKASPNSSAVFQTTSFKDNFKELLQEVDDLSNNIQLYNQQLMDTGGN